MYLQFYLLDNTVVISNIILAITNILLYKTIHSSLLCIIIIIHNISSLGERQNYQQVSPEHLVLDDKGRIYRAVNYQAPAWLLRDADLDSEEEDVEGGGDDKEEVGHVHHQEAGHDSVSVVGLVYLVYIKNCPG